MTCHDGKKSLPEVTEASGVARSLHSVSAGKYSVSVHATMQCVACHLEISDSATPHQKASGAHKPDCVQCHTELWEKAKKENLTREKERLGVVAQNIEAYKMSFHAKLNKEDKSRVNATCEQCHETHSFAVPTSGTTRRAEWHQTIPEVCGDKCHKEELKLYKTSVHGQAIDKGHNLKSAVCSDCHTSHAIGDTARGGTKLEVTWRCGNCHQDSKKTYLSTYHGQVSALGYANTAKCFDCHGGHRILKADQPRSKINPKNIIKTCRQCHNSEIAGMYDAPDGFASFQPHGVADLKKYPEIWVATQIMTQLLVGTFTVFWLHTILWFYREYRERRSHKKQRHIVLERRLAELPSHLRGKHFRRFSLIWRIAHFTFAITLMMLTLTGIPLFYPEAPWAKLLMDLLGGPHNAGVIHRTNAVIFASVFIWHLLYVAVKLARGWKEFKIFGPNSLIPNLQDGRDAIAMVKWFFGKAPRPVFDRWTYWEKFDYWAPFWGVTIIGVSGLVMWLPNVFGAFLPGWIFNVAAIFHGEEAFLAVVFLFTVHFFNNHFRPDKFPLEVVMFTGTFSLEEFKHEHAAEYKRLVDSGELEKHLVDAPSPARLAASKVLGFTLIAIGLTLLTLVAIGFFTGG
jgi:cytochrome b subunit of formate dehydrogenase